MTGAFGIALFVLLVIALAALAIVTPILAIAALFEFAKRQRVFIRRPLTALQLWWELNRPRSEGKAR